MSLYLVRMKAKDLVTIASIFKELIKHIQLTEESADLSKEEMSEIVNLKEFFIKDLMSKTKIDSDFSDHVH